MYQEMIIQYVRKAYYTRSKRNMNSGLCASSKLIYHTELNFGINIRNRSTFLFLYMYVMFYVNIILFMDN